MSLYTPMRWIFLKEHKWLGYISLAAVGYLIGWASVVQQNGMLLVIALLGMLLLCLKILKNWRWGVAAVAVWFALVDLIRKAAGGGILFLFISDFMVLFVFFAFYSRYLLFHNRTILEYTPLTRNVYFLFGGMVLLVILHALSVKSSGLVSTIAGIRTYLFYPLTLGIGLFFLTSETDVNRLFKFLLFLSFPIIFLSFVQIVMDELPAALVSSEHKIHSFGQYEVDLIPSTFASAKRYARFLMVVYPILYGIASYVNKPKIVRLTLFTLFLTAIIVSGARESLVVFLIFHTVFWLLTTRKQKKFYIRVILISLVVVFIWNSVMNFQQESIGAENYIFKYFLSNTEEWKTRALWYLYESFIIFFKQSDAITVLWGHGLGTYGQERLLSIAFEQGTINNGIEGAGDSGIFYMLNELGSIGFLYFVFVYLIVLRFLWKCMRDLRASKFYPLALSLFIIPIQWLFLFVKAHTLISDGMVSFGLWFSIGMLISLRYYGVNGCFPVLQHRREYRY